MTPLYYFIIFSVYLTLSSFSLSPSTHIYIVKLCWITKGILSPSFRKQIECIEHLHLIIDLLFRSILDGICRMMFPTLIWIIFQTIYSISTHQSACLSQYSSVWFDYQQYHVHLHHQAKQCVTHHHWKWMNHFRWLECEIWKQ